MRERDGRLHPVQAVLCQRKRCERKSGIRSKRPLPLDARKGWAAASCAGRALPTETMRTKERHKIEAPSSIGCAKGMGGWIQCRPCSANGNDANESGA